MTPLQEAIDAVLAFVRDHSQIADAVYNRGAVYNKPPEPHRTFYDEMERRSALVRDAVVDADPRLLGLIPPARVSFVTEPPTTFHGACNLPGQWVKDPRQPDKPARLQWGPEAALIGWREQMLALRAATKPKANASADAELPPNGTAFDEADVPAAFREAGRPVGPVLTTSYLGASPDWDLRGPFLTKAFDRGDLKHYIKVGKHKAYLFTELRAVRKAKTEREADQGDMEK